MRSLRRNAVLPVVVLAAFLVGAYRVHVQRAAEVDAANTVAFALISPASTAVAARVNFHHRLEPGNALLHGAGQSDEASFAAYAAAVAPAKPLLMMRYIDLRADIPSFFTGLRADLAAHPEFLIPQIGLSLNAGSAGKHYEAETAQGADDTRIASLCAGLTALHRPAFLRVGYEFNGPWNGYAPAPYIAAFRRIATAVHACAPGVAIVWNWSPDAELDRIHGGADPHDAPAHWQAFYPGDSFVDWWGLNLFSAESITSSITHAFLADAAAHRFPVMIAESSPRGHSVEEGQASIDAWFAPYFTLLRSEPTLKAFCYIDWDWRRYPQWAQWGDARLEANPQVLAFYRQQLTDLPLLANARGEAATKALLNAP